MTGFEQVQEQIIDLVRVIHEAEDQVAATAVLLTRPDRVGRLHWVEETPRFDAAAGETPMSVTAEISAWPRSIACSHLGVRPGDRVHYRHTTRPDIRENDGTVLAVSADRGLVLVDYDDNVWGDGGPGWTAARALTPIDATT